MYFEKPGDTLQSGCACLGYLRSEHCLRFVGGGRDTKHGMNAVHFRPVGEEQHRREDFLINNTSGQRRGGRLRGPYLISVRGLKAKED